MDPAVEPRDEGGVGNLFGVVLRAEVALDARRKHAALFRQHSYPQVLGHEVLWEGGEVDPVESECPKFRTHFGEIKCCQTSKCCQSLLDRPDGSLEHAADDFRPPGGVDVLGGEDVARRVQVEPVGRVARELLWPLRLLLLELLLAQDSDLLEEPPLRTAF